MTFIETSVFTKHIQEYLSDDEYSALQHFLNWQPEAGDIVPASGGVRMKIMALMVSITPYVIPICES